MATSMAAALAALNPTSHAINTTPTNTSNPQSYELIPPSMSKLIDVEAEIFLTSVQLDTLVREL